MAWLVLRSEPEARSNEPASKSRLPSGPQRAAHVSPDPCATAPPPQSPHPLVPAARRRKAPIIFGALVAAVAAAGTYLYVSSAGKESSDDAQIEGHVSNVAARVAGEVKRVLVRDNQHVKAGDVLVELDDA